MELVCIPREDVSKIWAGTVHDMIDAGFAASDLPMPDDILEQLESGARQLWVAVTTEARIAAAMLTSILITRHGKTFNMMRCGGSELTEWLPLLAQIEQYAKSAGCDSVLVTGRMGWRGVLKDYKIVSVTLEKRI
jgi:hypothetical protein